MKKSSKKVYTVATERKPDVARNSDGVESAVARHRQQEQKRKLYPLRINAQTVIYVPIEKYNEAYAESYRERMRVNAINMPF